MSKKIVNSLKTKVKELEYNYLKAQTTTSGGWSEVNSGDLTYKDLNRMDNIIINDRVITNEVISGLLRNANGAESSRLSLKRVFIGMFEYAGATVPNDLIIEELITNYNQAGYPGFFRLFYNEALNSCDLIASCSERISIHMECNDPNYLRCFSSTENVRVLYSTDGCMSLDELCDLSSSIEFQLQFKDGNVTYEDGKVLLTIPKELEDYKAGDDSLLDKLADVINKIVEYLKKLCEKLGFKFDTKVEYNSECNIKIEHKLGKPLKAIDEPDVYAVNGLKPKAQ
ncbi:hypothetical protein wVul_0036 [Wolbachia endosymbiont of Armadillidium vulgare str. wVulC]|uniref:hypothetical protein n=1 Tax=Wolbachia endosymbiont of Armadillidium vulgare TaxID=77039 RepID=UPI00064A6228|nr:hypothetical protein [Wolbachia endosymbiont of Armadillidium vulgare]KLT22833.1 hypothetical protein wVul_0036 [Wolbachia endosymbiont of Armadillidium vulgare str. wVulC]OJH31689.1 hypothetical protein Wxf_01085 [Wolbachia endosymbiont of Armadillidium vulgare]OJH32098.1 hypothetical protein Wxf_01519 [Wolbachia endosymbiont of Armadillidium vulgare]OJH32655.1 hypothetical protein Wxf_02099 [Wolbachia endosymbiont of Armadillidium vulgare]OJH33277.1 hypothetical protein Wxf_02753 [Wolbach